MCLCVGRIWISVVLRKGFLFVSLNRLEQHKTETFVLK